MLYYIYMEIIVNIKYNIYVEIIKGSKNMRVRTVKVSAVVCLMVALVFVMAELYYVTYGNTISLQSLNEKIKSASFAIIAVSLAIIFYCAFYGTKYEKLLAIPYLLSGYRVISRLATNFEIIFLDGTSRTKGSALTHIFLFLCILMVFMGWIWKEKLAMFTIVILSFLIAYQIYAIFDAFFYAMNAVSNDINLAVGIIIHDVWIIFLYFAGISMFYDSLIEPYGY